jgi:hypothetical protein
LFDLPLAQPSEPLTIASPSPFDLPECGKTDDFEDCGMQEIEKLIRLRFDFKVTRDDWTFIGFANGARREKMLLSIANDSQLLYRFYLAS